MKSFWVFHSSTVALQLKKSRNHHAATLFCLVFFLEGGDDQTLPTGHRCWIVLSPTKYRTKPARRLKVWSFCKLTWLFFLQGHLIPYQGIGLLFCCRYCYLLRPARSRIRFWFPFCILHCLMLCLGMCCCVVQNVCLCTVLHLGLVVLRLT